MICVWVLFSILCFYWQWQGCGALSILSSSSQGQRLHSASVRVSTWSMDVRQLTGSNLCKRGQVSDLIYIYYIQILYVQNGSRDRDPQIPACFEGMTQSQITLERCFQGAHVGDTERNSEALPVSLQLLGARGKDGGAAWLNRLIAFQEYGLVMSIWGLVAEILQCLGSE